MEYLLSTIGIILSLALLICIFLFFYWGYHFFRKAYNYLDLLDYLELQNKSNKTNNK